MNKLKKILQQRNLSQVAFINLIKEKTGNTYSPCRISKYVNGKVSFMSSKTWQVLSDTLGVPIEKII